MASDKHFRVDFHQTIVSRKGMSELDERLKEIFALKPEQRIRQLDDGNHYCLYDMSIYKHGPFYCGEIGRLSTDLIDPKGSITGEIGPMPIDETEGQVHQNFFAYHPPTSCLSMFFQQAGVRISRFRQYLNLLGEPADAFGFEPLLRPESAIKLLAGIKQTTKAEFKVRVPGNQQLLRDALADDAEIIKVAEKYQAATLRIELSIGHTGQPLHEKAVLLLKNLLKAREALDLAKVTGIDQEDVRAEINLLRSCFTTLL